MKTSRIYIIHCLLVFNLFLGALLNSSCDRNSDDFYDSFTESEIIDFVWVNMDYYYLWSDQMPQDLAKEGHTPFTFFDTLLYKDLDRWSFITDDYASLYASLQGVNKIMGYKLKLYKIENSSRRFAIIAAIFENSPAEEKGLKRGDLIISIDGEDLTDNNINDLLGKESYTISLGYLEDGMVTDANKSVSLTAIEMYQNPIIVDTVYTIDNKKIGYLFFESFLPTGIKTELNNVFSEFKESDVDELILDLRYNGGGSIDVAIELGSLIAPASAVDQVFLHEIWNENLDYYFTSSSGSEYNIARVRSNENNLNLSNIHIITTTNTASASEIIINGLMPYMNVITIGDTTHGKYTGSVTLHDQYDRHNWAIQPIVLKSANANGYTDFKDGFPPKYYLEDGSDDFAYQIGDIREACLYKALSLIVPMTKSTRSGYLLNNSKSLGLYQSKLDKLKNNLISDKKIPLNIELY